MSVSSDTGADGKRQNIEKNGEEPSNPLTEEKVDKYDAVLSDSQTSGTEFVKHNVGSPEVKSSREQELKESFSNTCKDYFDKSPAEQLDGKTSSGEVFRTLYNADSLSEKELQKVSSEAIEKGTENTWKCFCDDSSNQKKYHSLHEAKDAYIGLIENESPWPDKEAPELKELPVGTRFEMAMAPGQPDNKPGAFGTYDNIENKEFVRDKLAVKEDWKPDIDRVNTYEVVNPLPVKEGRVGPQIDIPVDKYLHGGASQFQMCVTPRERMDYITLVNSRKV